MRSRKETLSERAIKGTSYLCPEYEWDSFELLEISRHPVLILSLKQKGGMVRLLNF